MLSNLLAQLFLLKY